LIVPGLNGSGADHWQTPSGNQYQFELIHQRDWENPDVEPWVQSLDEAILARSDKVVIVAHSLGCWVEFHRAALHADRNKNEKQVRSSARNAVSF
jgi:uncharacterized protein